jgi:tricorn protease
VDAADVAAAVAEEAVAASRSGRATAAAFTICKAAASTRWPSAAAARIPAQRRLPRRLPDAAVGGEDAAAAAAAAAATTTATGAGPRRIDFSVRMVIDIAAERKQVFEEAWRVMKNRYYDPKMHGANWAAAKDKYEALLGNIADTEELHNVIMEMIGEMNSSHTGISGGGRLPGEENAGERIQTRYPGFDLAPDASGYYKVSYIYRKGPADHDYVKLACRQLHPGGERQGSEDQRELLEAVQHSAREEIRIRVNSKPSMDGSWTIDLEPLTTAAQSESGIRALGGRAHRDGEELSGGEIGYLHIKAMDAPSLAKFQRDLLDNQDKKALIIDERFNGGGGIDQELLEILNQRKPYQSSRGRDSIY